jgi:hypothetical protein
MPLIAGSAETAKALATFAVALPLSLPDRQGREFQPTPVAAKGVKPFQTNGKVSSCIAPCF